MTKTELVAEVAKKADLKKVEAEKAVNATIETITKSLKKGEKVSFVGFGTFDVKKRAARQGINPATGKKIQIKACKVPSFKAGKALKEAVK